MPSWSLIFLILLVSQDLKAASKKERRSPSPKRPCVLEVDEVTATARLAELLREEDRRIADYLCGDRPGVKSIFQYLIDHPGLDLMQVKAALGEGVRGELRQRMIEDELPPGPDFLEHRHLPRSIADFLAARQAQKVDPPPVPDPVPEAQPVPIVETVTEVPAPEGPPPEPQDPEPEVPAIAEKPKRPRHPMLAFNDDMFVTVTAMVAAVDAINRYENYLIARFGHCQFERIPPKQVGSNRPGVPPLGDSHLPERFGVLGQRWEELQIFDRWVGRIDDADRTEPPPPKRRNERVVPGPTKRGATFQILWEDAEPKAEVLDTTALTPERAGKSWEQISEETRIKQIAFLREFISEMQAFDDYLIETSEESRFDVLGTRLSRFKKRPLKFSALRTLATKHKAGRSTVGALFGWLPELLDLRLRMGELRDRIVFDLESRGPVTRMKKQFEAFRSFLRNHRPSLLVDFEEVEAKEVRGILPPLSTDETMAAAFKVGIGRLGRIRARPQNQTLANHWLQFSKFHSRVMRYRHIQLLRAVPDLDPKQWRGQVGNLAEAFELPPEDVAEYLLNKFRSLSPEKPHG